MRNLIQISTFEAHYTSKEAFDANAICKNRGDGNGDCYLLRNFDP